MLGGDRQRQPMSLLAFTNSALAPTQTQAHPAHLVPLAPRVLDPAGVQEAGGRGGSGAGRQGGAVGGLRSHGGSTAKKRRQMRLPTLAWVPSAAAINCGMLVLMLTRCGPPSCRCACIASRPPATEREQQGRRQTALARGECCRWGQPAARRQGAWGPALKLPRHCRLLLAGGLTKGEVLLLGPERRLGVRASVSSTGAPAAPASASAMAAALLKPLPLQQASRAQEGQHVSLLSCSHALLCSVALAADADPSRKRPWLPAKLEPP